MDRLELLRKEVDAALCVMDDATRRNASVHLYGVSLFCALLAQRRGEDAELAAMAGMLHDLSAYQTGVREEHAHQSGWIAGEILSRLGVMTREEVGAICCAVYNHSDKHRVDSGFDEVLKDADALHHHLYNPGFPISEKEIARCRRIKQELGFPPQEIS